MNNSSIDLASSISIFAEGKKIMKSSPKEGMQLIKDGLELAEKEGEYSLACEILIFKSRTFRFQGKIYRSMENLNKAFRLLNQHIPHDQKNLAYIYKEYGSLYTDGFNNSAIGLEYSFKCLKLNVEETKSSVYINIGCQYINLEEYDKAHIYLNKALNRSKEKCEYYLLSFVYENFGNLFKNQGKYKEAIEHYQLGIDACEKAYEGLEKQSVDYIYCYILVSIAESYLEEDKIDLAVPMVEKIMNKAKESNLMNSLSQAYLLEGKLLLLENNTEAFEALFQKMIPFCSAHLFFGEKERWYEMIIEMYEKQGEFEKAFFYSKCIIANIGEQKTKTQKLNFGNILENKEIEILELENRNREIQLQKEQLEQFAYIVAHDLKTPLSNISNFVGLFSKKYKGELEKEYEDYLKLVEENSKHLYKMLDDLLQYITFSNEKGELPTCSVKKTLRHILENRKEFIKKKNATITYEKLGDVKMHPFHLECIFDNLISNSLKFSKKNESCEIHICLKENEHDYCFKVEDNGIGIEEKFHQKIFEMFNRLDKINYQGTGMGLSICKKIVNSYGGKIGISINEKGGSTFDFNIPKATFNNDEL